ncbi:hypothetical protein HYDPIDRAFT_26743 [Hydnomerulius pinastri MD-312]|nr:hypothetical protein HYDPIDRAFT_26743 [Hydnomerulius pinastri MD-312]
MSNTTLPDERVHQAHVSVSAIAAGYLVLPSVEVFEDARINNAPGGIRVPTFAFLVQHPTHGKLLFDLGLRKQGKGYPPALKEDLELFAVECEQDIVDKLQVNNTKPEDINYVVYRQGSSHPLLSLSRLILYSHLHFDHVGDLTPFQHATLVMGADAEPLIIDAKSNPDKSMLQAISDKQRIRYLNFDGSAEDDTHGMPISTLVQPLGDFERALDLFSDGSLYIIDTSGHMEGHVSALARVSQGTFVLLAGDCCHDRQCYDPVATKDGTVRTISQDNHHEWEVAKDTLSKLIKMSQRDDLVVVLAHEKERETEMPLFPDTIDGQWVRDQVAKRTRISC